jgi:hypothetical protein
MEAHFTWVPDTQAERKRSEDFIARLQALSARGDRTQAEKLKQLLSH